MTKGRELLRKGYGFIYILIISNIFIAVNSEVQYYPFKNTPTVYPADPFDPVADAATLRKAMKGFGADPKTIVEVLTKRGIVQRLEIAETFKTNFGKDLTDELKYELPENLRSVVIALMTPLPQYYAKQLHNAVSGLRTDKETIIEILSTLSNYGVRTIAKFYEELYSRTLEHDLKAATSGSFQRLIVSTLQANRDENQGVNEAKATVDAQALLDADKDAYGDKVTEFHKILVSRSYQQLRATFAEYERLTGHDIAEKIGKDIFGSVKMGFLGIVKCVKSKVGFFAEKLNTAKGRILTDHSTLIRIIVSRSEIDLGDIRQAFVDKYGQTLENYITDLTSGYYQKALLSLLGN